MGDSRLSFQGDFSPSVKKCIVSIHKRQLGRNEVWKTREGQPVQADRLARGARPTWTRACLLVCKCGTTTGKGV